MSELKDAKNAISEKDSKTLKKKSKMPFMVGGGVLLALVLGFGVWGVVKNNTIKVDDTPVVESNVNNMADATTLIRNQITSAYENGAYLNMTIDQDLAITMIFDKNGRAYAETPYSVGMFMEKDKSMMARQDGSGDPYFSVVDDMTPLYLIERMTTLVDEGKASIVEEKNEVATNTGEAVQLDKDIKTYTMKATGKNILELFNCVSDTYAKDQLKSLYNFEDANSLSDSDEFNVTVSIGDNQLAGIAQVVTSDTPYVCWLFPGYLELGGWELDSTYWNKDMDVSDFDSTQEKFKGVQTTIGDLINKYVDEHPELLEAIESTIEETTASENVGESSEVVDETASEVMEETTSEVVEESSEVTEETSENIESSEVNAESSESVEE